VAFLKALWTVTLGKAALAKLLWDG
jgi:hypothetical protein